MSELKCPFCGKHLDAVVKNQNDWIYSCGNPSCEFFDDCDNYEKKHYLATPEFWQELIRTREALDKGMEHITGLNNMIESWYKLINSDEDQNAKFFILKYAISTYVENKGGDNE